MQRIVLIGVGLLLLGPSLAAGDSAADDRRMKARERLKSHLAKVEGAQRGSLVDIEAAALEQVYKNFEFFGLRFRRYPSAVTPVPPLQPNNLFAVTAKDVVHITDQEQLTKFFQKQLTEMLEDDLRVAATASWLRLAQELQEDGFFEFEPPELKLRGSTCHGELRVVNKRGDLGELDVTMNFDADGLDSVQVTGKFVPGIRPKCQATRLLDADPVVREIMRKDILVMGKRCKPYLDEVRKRANPALQTVIDELWQQIIDEQR